MEVLGSEKLMTTALAWSSPALCEHLLVRRVAVHHRIAGLPGRADPAGIQIDGNVFETLRLEHARDVLADAAEAAQDDVLALRDLDASPALRARWRSGAAPSRAAGSGRSACCC